MRVISQVNRDKPQSLLSTVCWTVLIGYFLYHIVQGDRGMLAMARLEKEIAKSEQQLGALRAEREAMDHKVYLLRPTHLDADMLDEQARKQLGYIKPNEIMILLPPSAVHASANTENDSDSYQ